MNKYRIRYRKGETGLRYVQADTFNGLLPSSDTYTFKCEGEIVAAMPKAVVVSVERVNLDEDE